MMLHKRTVTGMVKIFMCPHKAKYRRGLLGLSASPFPQCVWGGCFISVLGPLMIILIIDLSLSYFLDWLFGLKISKNSFPKAKLMSSNGICHPGNSLESKDFQRIIIEDQENHQIFTFEKQVSQNIWYFCFKILKKQNSFNNFNNQQFQMGADQVNKY